MKNYVIVCESSDENEKDKINKINQEEKGE